MSTEKLLALSGLGFAADMELGIAASRLLEAVNEPPKMREKIKREVALMLAPDLNPSLNAKDATYTTEPARQGRKVSIRKPERKVKAKTTKKAIKAESEPNNNTKPAPTKKTEPPVKGFSSSDVVTKPKK